MNPFFERVGWTLLPGGYRVVDAKELLHPQQEGMVVIEIRDISRTLDPSHWFHHTRNATPIGITTWEWGGGHWNRYTKDGYAPDGAGPKGVRCITPAAGQQQQQQQAQGTGAHMALWVSELRGPLHLAAKAQDLAYRWKARWGGVFVACDTQWKGQAYFIAPSWGAFWTQVMHRTPAHLRCFYEDIPPDTPVRAFADLDAKDKKDARIIALGKRRVLESFFDSVEQTFQECYPEAAYVLTRRDFDVWDSSSATKLSLHVVTNSQRCPLLWENNQTALRSFMARVRVRMFRLLLDEEPDPNRCTLLDMSVYSRHRKFRIPRCTKRGKQQYLEWYRLPWSEPREPTSLEDWLVVPQGVQGRHVIMGALPELAPAPHRAAAPTTAPPRPAFLLAEEQQCVREELRAVLGPAAEGKYMKCFPQGHGLSMVTTVKECPFHNGPGAPLYTHENRTQHAFFGRHDWMQWCSDDTDGACKGKRLRHPYQVHGEQIQTMLRRLFPPPPLPAGAIVTPCVTLKERVLALFPEHAAHWAEARSVWRRGLYFGPCTLSLQGVDYSWGVGSLLARTKQDDKVVSTQVRAAPLDPAPPEGVKCAGWLERVTAFLAACNGWRGSLGVLRFQFQDPELPTCLMQWFGPEGPAGVLRFHGAKASWHVDPQHRSAVPEAIQRACTAFMEGMALLPLSTAGDAEKIRAEWARSGYMANVNTQFVPDNDTTRDLDFSLLPPEARQGPLLTCSPPGEGKTTGILGPAMSFAGDIVADLRVMADKLSSEAGTARHLTGPKDAPRVRRDLAREARPVTICVNSYARLEGRSCERGQFWDESRSILDVMASDRMDAEPALTLLRESVQSGKLKRLILASADITPRLEGRLMAELFGPDQYHMLHRAIPRPAAGMRTIQVRSEEELWTVYVQLLRHNAAAASPDAWKRIWFPCNTKAAVKRAERLQQIHWPGAPAIFVHADRKEPLPENFMEDPNTVWLAYAIVCGSPKMKVGISCTLKDHFDVMLALACTSTTDHRDFLQSLRRVRTHIPLFLYCIRAQGTPTGPQRPEEALELLKGYCALKHIDRALLPAVKPISPMLQWIRSTIAEARAHSQRHYAALVQESLRKLQVEIELGLPAGVPLVVGGTALAPLPQGTDIRGPDSKKEHVYALLNEAHDLTRDEYRALCNQRERCALTALEELCLERYQMRKEWEASGGQTHAWEDWVELMVCRNWKRKVNKARMVLGREGSVAVRDERTLIAQPAAPIFEIAVRTHTRAFLELLPGFNVNRHLLGANGTYRITRDQLDDGTVLEAQLAMMRRSGTLLPKPSTVQGDDAKRVISHANTVLRSMGCKTLEPERNPKRYREGGTTKQRVRYWTLGESPAPVLAYLGPSRPPVPAAAAAAAVVVVDPVLSKDYHSVFDRNTGTMYALAPLAPTQSDSRVLCLPVLAERQGQDLGMSLLYAMHVEVDRPPFHVAWEWFHRDRFHRIQFALCHWDVLYWLLKEWGYSASALLGVGSPQHYPHPAPDPQHCLEPRLSLTAVGDGLWKAVDVSLYAP